MLPPFETFRDAESYYATLAHETTHWTAHESRLARDFGAKRFGSEGVSVLLTFCMWSHILIQNLCRRVVFCQRLIYYKGRSTF